MQHRWNKLVYTECAGVIDKGQLHPLLNNTLCLGVLDRCHEIHSKTSHNLQADHFLKHNHFEKTILSFLSFIIFLLFLILFIL